MEDSVGVAVSVRTGIPGGVGVTVGEAVGVGGTGVGVLVGSFVAVGVEVGSGGWQPLLQIACPAGVQLLE